MKVYKDRQFLIFDFEDGKTVQYDLSTKKTIGKLGKPVNDLRGQLSGFSIGEILESFDNEEYKNFLKFVRTNDGAFITNVGTLLEKAKSFSRYEQYFSAGIQDVDRNIKFPITDIPNGLLKICKNHGLRLTNILCGSYKEDPDFFTVAFSEDFNSLSPQDIISLLTCGVYRSYYGARDETSYIHKLHESNNYNVKSLLIYIDNLMTYEALERPDTIIREFFDYVTMMNKISAKYEKYPKNFLTTHVIASRNYNRLKETFIEKDFQNRIDKNLEFKYGDYVFIYPSTTQEIKEEAVQQNNCVASYISRVISGNCHILFMRNKYSPTESLVTVEVRDKKIVQAKGKYNRDLYTEEQKAIDKYNLVKGEKSNVA